MTENVLSDVRACVFDAYGTLFDVHSAVGRHRARLGEKADRVSEVWRDKQLQYTWLRSLMGRYAPFWRVTGDALDFALESAGVGDQALRDDLMNAYLSLTAYPEVRGVLEALRERGQVTAILSNGSPEMLDAAVSGAGLDDLLDAVLSVDGLGVYKPHPSVYRLAVTQLKVGAKQVSFQSSNAWDVAGAAAFGFKVAWVNRFGQIRERLPDGPDAELRDLNGLLELVGA